MIIFNKTIIFIFLLFVELLYCSRAPIVHIPIHHEQFVDILVGNPGKYKTFRLDFSSNQTVTLFSLPSSYSRSYQYQKELGNLGSEIFYVGCHKERFSVLYDPSKLKYDTKFSYDGVIGLGYQSELWYHWTKYTLSSTTLVLGDYDYSLIRKYHSPFSISCEFNKPIKVEINQIEYNLYYSPEQYYTKLPKELFYKSNSLSINILNNGKRIHLDSSDFVLRLPTGFNLTILRMQPKDSKDIVLGEHTVRQLVSYNDIIHKNRTIYPAYNFFDNGNSQPCFNSIIGIILTVIFIFWIALVYTEKITSNSRHSKFLSRIELNNYLCSILILHIEHNAYKVSRFFYHHIWNTYSNEFPYYDVLMIFLFINFAIGITLFIINLNTNHMIYFRSACFESILLLVLWVSQIENHKSYLDHIGLIVLSSIYADMRCLVFLFNLIQHPKNKSMIKLIILLIYSILSQLFLIFYNILPFFNRFWYDFPNKTFSTIVLWTLFSGIPILFLFSNIYISELRITMNIPISKIENKKIHQTNK